MQKLPNIPLNIRLLTGNRRKWIRSKYTVEVSIWRVHQETERDVRPCLSQNLLSETMKEAELCEQDKYEQTTVNLEYPQDANKPDWVPLGSD